MDRRGRKPKPHTRMNLKLRNDVRMALENLADAQDTDMTHIIEQLIERSAKRRRLWPK